MYPEAKDYRLQGSFWGAGITAGRTWWLGEHWRIEAEAGVAGGLAAYDRYDCAHCGSKLADERKAAVVPITGVDFKAMKQICDALVADKFWPQNEKAIAAKPTGSWNAGNNEYTGEMGLACNYLPKDFPFCFNILRGAAYTTFDKTNRFYKYPKYFNTSDIGGAPYDPTEESGHTAEDYYYPAQLLYFGNSPLRTSDIEHVEGDYPETCNDWIDDDEWPTKKGDEDDWTGTHVKSTSRSVAMKDLIHYGVAMLETRVGYTTAALANGYIYDNNAAVQRHHLWLFQ